MSQTNRGVRQYIEGEVRQNRHDAKEQREIATSAISQVRDAIPHGGEVVYTGSSYEGNATKNSSDYDVMVNAVPQGAMFQVEHVRDKPGFSKLKYLSGGDDQFVSKCVTNDGYLSSQKVVQTQVQPAVDKLIKVQDHGGHLDVNGKQVQTKRSVHGPAVTLDLKSNNQNVQVDVVALVPQSNVVGGKEFDYVAKPSGGQTSANHDTLWRQSSSKQEKDMFTGVDAGNQVHRDVLKTAKTVRANDPQLSSLPSYVVKTAEMSLIDKDAQRVSQGAEPKPWGSEHTADRVKDLGKELYQGLDKGELRVPTNRSVNILSGTSEQQREQWKQAIGHNGEGLLDKVTGDNK